MKPNPCCNEPGNLETTWHQDTLYRKVLRLFRDEELPHRLVDTCVVCGCRHYVMIVPEIPVGSTGFGIGV